MSTTLQRAAKLSAAHKLHPTKHREIVITERNKQIIRDIRLAVPTRNRVG